MESFFLLAPAKKRPKAKETYGFKSSKSPPTVPELKEFEDGMLNIVQNVKFRRHIKEF